VCDFLKARGLMTFITVPKANDDAALRVYCFPFAGGNAQAFSSWLKYCPPAIELAVIEYPGRGKRFGEPAIDSCVELAKAIASEINAAEQKPFILLGYSMGGAIAFEVTRYLKRPPEALHLCASCPPLLNTRYLLSDFKLLQEVNKIEAIDERLLQDAEMRRIILDLMRNDFKVLDTYQPTIATCTSPVHLWVGAQDVHVPEDKAKNWQQYCPTAVQFHSVMGDHFFIRHAGEKIMAALLAQNFAVAGAAA
jgi:medium-chain acyl-[acyl-carrier-protein] hydrolase